jgi:intracellular multiplication protein IcmE
MLGKITGSIKDSRSRMLVAIGVAGAGVLGGFALFGTSEAVPVSKLGGVPSQMDTTVGGAQQAASPAYQEAVDRRNAEIADRAHREGESAVPTIGAISRVGAARPDGQAARPDIPKIELASASSVGSVAQAPVAAYNKDLAAAMLKQMEAITKLRAPVASELVVFEPAKAPQDEIAVAAAGQAGAGGAGATAPTPSRAFVKPGTIAYATIINGVRSDLPTPVVARIDGGALDGSTLIGQFNQPNRAKAMAVQFTSLTTRDGLTYPINAFAVAPQNAEAGIASSVDGRYLERYVLPLAASFIEGVAGSESRSPVTVVIGSNGGASSIEDEPTLQDSMAAGVAQTAQTVGDILRENQSLGPLVRLSAGSNIGVIFVGTTPAS